MYKKSHTERAANLILTPDKRAEIHEALYLLLSPDERKVVHSLHGISLREYIREYANGDTKAAIEAFAEIDAMVDGCNLPAPLPWAGETTGVMDKVIMFSQHLGEASMYLEIDKPEGKISPIFETVPRGAEHHRSAIMEKAAHREIALMPPSAQDMRNYDDQPPPAPAPPPTTGPVTPNPVVDFLYQGLPPPAHPPQQDGTGTGTASVISQFASPPSSSSSSSHQQALSAVPPHLAGLSFGPFGRAHSTWEDVQTDMARQGSEFTRQVHDHMFGRDQFLRDELAQRGIADAVPPPTPPGNFPGPFNPPLTQRMWQPTTHRQVNFPFYVYYLSSFGIGEPSREDWDEDRDADMPDTPSPFPDPLESPTKIMNREREQRDKGKLEQWKRMKDIKSPFSVF
ncbi:hypothetical protein B0H66DRAFT_532489 [Apodospora peruviana]|uniref:Uncharacterized protein n=1 Tax=Apodospora peruviana TaxID=516989 RepID=A0AAE0I3K5_9PEZI|nr:hypothetical protein B0H66DRAFT_532489 [Apodospora peruviana]